MFFVHCEFGRCMINILAYVSISDITFYQVLYGSIMSRASPRPDTTVLDLIKSNITDTNIRQDYNIANAPSW